MDECTLVSCAKSVKIWELSINGGGHKVSAEFSLHTSGNTNAVCWNHTAKVLASGGDDGRAALSLPTGQLLCYLPQDPPPVELKESLMAVGFGGNSRYLVTGGTSKLVKIWDLKSQVLAKTLKGHVGTISSVSFNHDSTMVASGSASGDVLLHNLLTTSPAPSKPLRAVDNGAITAIEFSPFNKHQLAGTSDGGSLSLWNVTTKMLEVAFEGAHEAPATCLCYSAYNHLLLCTAGMDAKLNFYDIEEKKIVKQINTSVPLVSLSFMNDGVSIAGGTATGTIMIFDLRAGDKARVVINDAHDGQINALMFKQKAPKRSGSSSRSKTTAASTSSLTTSSSSLPTSSSSSSSLSASSTRLPASSTTAPTSSRPNLTQHEKLMTSRGQSIFKTAVTNASKIAGNTNVNLNPHVSNTNDNTNANDYSNTNDNNTIKEIPSATSTPMQSTPPKHRLTPPSTRATLTTTTTATDIFSPLPMPNAGAIPYPLSTETHASKSADRRIGTSSHATGNDEVPSSFKPSILATPKFAREKQRLLLLQQQQQQQQQQQHQHQQHHHHQHQHQQPESESVQAHTTTQPTANTVVPGEALPMPQRSQKLPQQQQHPQHHPQHPRQQQHHNNHQQQHHHQQQQQQQHAYDVRGDSESAAATPTPPTTSFQTEFMKNMIEESLASFRLNIHRDVQNMHIDLIRQFQIQKNELETMVEGASVNESLCAEIERLRIENQLLRERF